MFTFSYTLEIPLLVKFGLKKSNCLLKLNLDPRVIQMCWFYRWYWFLFRPETSFLSNFIPRIFDPYFYLNVLNLSVMISVFFCFKVKSVLFDNFCPTIQNVFIYSIQDEGPTGEGGSQKSPPSIKFATHILLWWSLVQLYLIQIRFKNI